MTQNITNKLDQYTYTKLTRHTCIHGLQSPVLWEVVLELYQEDMYVAAPYQCTEEPQLTFHKS